MTVGCARTMSLAKRPYVSGLRGQRHPNMQTSPPPENFKIMALPGGASVEEEDEDEEVDLGSSDTESDSESDCDYVPPKKKRKRRGQAEKKKQAKPAMPNLVELSLPKPAARLDPTLSLGDAALAGCVFGDPLTLSSTRRPKRGIVILHNQKRPTRNDPGDARVAEYKAFYDKQLPGMCFYYDSYHALLMDDGHVLGGSTFQLLTLSTSDANILILDVLALAVHPDRARKGVGSTLVHSLKMIARREAKAAGPHIRPLLLTQADLSCVGFWGKNHFKRALDANALVRRLRRGTGHTIFDGATPMARLLPHQAPLKH